MSNPKQSSLGKSKGLQPSPAPLAQAIRGGLIHEHHKQKGFNLIETLLVLGVVAVGIGITYGLYQNVSAAAKIENEAGNINQLRENVLSSYAANYDFGALSQTSALDEGLFPRIMLDPQTGAARSTWGGEVMVSATNIERNSQTLTDWGFVISYADVPTSSCVRLVNEAGGGFTDVRVEGDSVGVGQEVNVSLLAELCNREGGADIQFIYAKVETASSEGGLGALCADALPGAPENQTIACPSGQYGLITQSRSAFCSSAYGSYSWTPWTTMSDNCMPCPSPETRMVSQELTCPSGQVGSITQVQEEQRTANCPIPGPNGPSENTEWGDWTATSAWSTTSNTCAPACEVPTPSTETRWTPVAGTCPSGQYGTKTWEAQESRTASCPSPTGTFVWSGWATTGVLQNEVNTCAPCPSTPETQTLACPSGQFGTWNQSRTFNCPTGAWGSWATTSNTCAPCPSPENRSSACPSGQYGALAETRSFNCSTGVWNAWTVTSNTCTVCPSTPQTQSQTLACPSGQFGAIEQSRSRSFDCGAGAWGSYSPWTTTSNTCVSCPAPQTETQNLSCSAGQYGTIAQSRDRTFDCTNGVWNSWSNWSTTNNTCTSCPTAAPQDEFQWVANPSSCASGEYGTRSWEREQKRTRTVSYTCPAGTTTLPAATFGPWGTWSDTGSTRNQVNTCTTCPAPSTTPQTQQVAAPNAACPAGQYGTITRTERQDRTRTNSYVCPAGTTSLPAVSYTYSPWVSSGVFTTTSNTCTNCPSPINETQNQWVLTPSTCPTGQFGTRSWEREQVQSRTVSYSCPAGTTALPSATVGPWGPWSDTGQTRNQVNTCATCPTSETQTLSCASGQYGTIQQSRTFNCPTGTWNAWTTTSNTCTACPAPSNTPESQQVAAPNAACPAGQYGTITRTQRQDRTRTNTYTCPAGTTTLPSPTFTYTPWVNSGVFTTTSNTCTACPPSVPQSQTQWVLTPSTCPTGQFGTRSWEREQVQTRTITYACPAGTTTLPAATTPPWGPWTDTGNTRNQVNTCATCPTSQTQTLSCASGQYGTIQQSRTFNCPAGTWNAWTTTSNTCTSCPAPVNTPESQQVAATPLTCPAGQYGTITRTQRQDRTKTVSYACPAGTTALPAASTTYTPWVNSGVFTNTSNTCANCPAPSTQTQTQWVASSAACPSGQIGSNTWEREQSQSRSVSYTCPAGTTALPAATYGSWSPWANTGATRNVNNTCAPACVVPTPNPEGRWINYLGTCPSGQEHIPGNPWTFRYREVRTWSCPAPTGSATATPWAWDGVGGEYVSGGCQPIASNAPCNVGFDMRRAGINSNCAASGSYPSNAGTVPSGSLVYFSFYSPAPGGFYDGSAAYMCNNGVVSSTRTPTPSDYCDFVDTSGPIE